MSNFDYDLSLNSALKGFSKKTLIHAVKDKTKKKNRVYEINYHGDPFGDWIESITGIHFGITESEKKRIKKEIDEEIEREKDYLDML